MLILVLLNVTYLTLELIVTRVLSEKGSPIITDNPRRSTVECMYSYGLSAKEHSKNKVGSYVDIQHRNLDP